MHALEIAPTFALPADPVAVVGDWHGDTPWARRLLPALGAEGLRTLLHVGDFGLWDGPYLPAVDEQCEHAGIERVLVTPGNHEHWGVLSQFEREHPGHAVRVSERVWVLPRPFRFTLGELKVLSMGGAPSVDFELRTPGVNWFPEELASAEAFELAAAGGTCDVLLAHDCPGGGETPAVTRIRATNPHRFTRSALEYAARGAQMLGELWDAVDPRVTYHGHFHVRDSGMAGDRRVESLDMNNSLGNAVLLDPRDTLRPARGVVAAGRA